MLLSKTQITVPLFHISLYNSDISFARLAHVSSNPFAATQMPIEVFTFSGDCNPFWDVYLLTIAIIVAVVSNIPFPGWHIRSVMVVIVLSSTRYGLVIETLFVVLFFMLLFIVLIVPLMSSIKPLFTFIVIYIYCIIIEINRTIYWCVYIVRLYVVCFSILFSTDVLYVSVQEVYLTHSTEFTFIVSIKANVIKQAMFVDIHLYQMRYSHVRYHRIASVYFFAHFKVLLSIVIYFNCFHDNSIVWMKQGIYVHPA